MLLLDKLSEEMRAATIEEMRTVLNPDKNSLDLFHGMMHYHLGWCDRDMNPTNMYTGKLFRPILLLLTCRAAGGQWQEAVPAAAAVELLHNFSLIHDDIQDASPLRRGRDSIWKIWGGALGINAGDAMFAKAHLALARLNARGVPANKVIEVLRRFDETSIQMSQGQYADLFFEKQQDVTIDDYIKMISGKTAALVALCSELGAIIAGTEDDVVANYHNFGLNCGLAFQIIDDILGIWGNESVSGKTTQSDIYDRKKSLPILFALENSLELQELYRNNITDSSFVEQAIILMNQVCARDYAMKIASEYTQKALIILESVCSSSDMRNIFKQIISTFYLRNY